MQRDLARLGDQSFDLLVVGGGINGAGLARDAALRGLKVALVDKGDFGCGTSSRSSKLIHGGLRYLEHGHLRLVFQALRERATLLRIAPHLVRTLDFVVPITRHSRRRPLTLRAGLTLYDLLSLGRAWRRHELARGTRLAELEPALAAAGIERGALFSDCQVDDARLVLANVIDAAERGAVVASYVELAGFELEAGRIRGARLRDLLDDGREYRLRAQVVVNATGPWSDCVTSLGGEPAGRVKLSRGSHVIVSSLTRRAALLLEAPADGRPFFVIPWGDASLIGTTECAHAGSADAVAPTAEEVAYLLSAVRTLLGAAAGELAPYAAYAGLRPLAASGDSLAATSREHRISVGASGLVSLAGGKLTTYRLVAAELADRVMALLGRAARRAPTEKLALPGGEAPDLELLERESLAEAAGTPLAAHHVRRLARAHGSRVGGLLAAARAHPELCQPLCRHDAALRLDADWAARHEAARRVSDVLLRRTRAGYAPCCGLDAAEATAAALGAVLGWSAARIAAETAAYAHEAPRLPLAAGLPPPESAL